MVLLGLFAFVAGIGTALSPCVLPVLPIALSAGATGGSRRPLGIVTGLTLSFTFATVALVYVIHALGLPDDLLRKLAIAGLIGFGIALAIPAVGDRIEARLSRVAGGRRARGGEDGGFGSGLLLGASLGLVYAPCAGPILAGVITLSASQTFTAGRLATALAYGIGSAVALYVLMIGGRRLARRLARRSGRLQQGLGVVMVVVGVLMLANVDTRFQNAVANDLPGFLVNPTSGLESSSSVSKALERVRGQDNRAKPPMRDSNVLTRLFPAPDLQGTQRWFNTPGGAPLSLAELRRQKRVVLIDFWTYTCINCIRTLPQLKAWDAKYRAAGLTVVGVHTPEFPFEKDAGNVEDAIHQDGLRYPVVQDNDYETWNAYGNQYWPAEYLIGADGYVRYVHFGEGEYGKTENAIRTLLDEAGKGGLGGMSHARVQTPMELATPETYLGSMRAERFLNGPIRDGTRRYACPRGALPHERLAYGGTWTITPEAATAGRRARLGLNFRARRAYLVLGSEGGHARKVKVRLDGRPHGTVTGTRQRLYTLPQAARAGRHQLELRPEAGVRGYAFTFG